MKEIYSIAAALLWPVVLGAQETARLTLSEALVLARQNSPSYRRAVAQADATGADVRAGWGAFLPDLRGNLSFSGVTGTTVTGQDDFGRPVSLPQPVDFDQSSATQSLSSQLTVFDGLRNVKNFQAARAGRDAALAGAEVERRRVEAEVSRRFYAALRTSRLIRLEDDLLQSAREQLDANRRLFRVAATDQVDVLGAEVDVSQQELALERARSDARKAVLELGEQIGVTEDVPFEPAGELPAVFDPSELDVDTLLERAMRENPRIEQLRANHAAQRLRAGAAHGELLPTITAGASFNRSVSLSSREALFEFNPKNRTLQFQLGLTWPIFTNFDRSQRIAQADLSRREAEENLREGRLQITREIRSAVIDLRNAYQSVQLARRAAELSRRRVDLAREQFRLGAVTFTNLQTVIAGGAQAERDLINREFEFADALIVLEQRAGRRVR